MGPDSSPADPTGFCLKATWLAGEISDDEFFLNLRAWAKRTVARLEKNAVGEITWELKRVLAAPNEPDRKGRYAWYFCYRALGLGPEETKRYFREVLHHEL